MASPPVFTVGQTLTSAAMNQVGLWLVKTQTIGTGVSSVTVTGAFSADYDAYKIVISGGVGSATAVLQMQLGATATGYYYGGDARTYGGVTLNIQAANGTNWYAGEASVNTIEMNIDIKQPFLAKNTTFTGSFGAARTDAYWLAVGGYLADTTSYTAFTITPSGGATLTGGTIRVYGYRN
jgi:hypothetical protein